MDSPILRHQRKFNSATRDDWHGFAPHRARVMAALLAAAGGRLAVLGAGNLNDVDLARLLARFDQVHLIDLDAEAPADGLARQLGGTLAHPDTRAVRVHGGVDLSGIGEHLDAFWTSAPDGPADAAAVGEAVRAASDAPQRLVETLPGPFDVVVSTCLLTQLVDQVVNTLGATHPGTPRLAAAVRDGHLRLLVELTARGGTAVLVTDTLSTAVFPDLAAEPDAALPGLLERCAQDDRCFAGTNPRRVTADLSTLPGVARTTRSAPWTWAVGSLTFLVYAVSATKHAGRGSAAVATGPTP